MERSTGVDGRPSSSAAMFGLGPTELIIVIVMLLFGAGRISRIAAEMGSGIRAFRQGISDEAAEESDAS